MKLKKIKLTKKIKHKLKRKVVNFSGFVIIFFSVIGIFLTGIIVHENSHRWDYKSIEKIGEDICYLDELTNGDNKLAYYQFYPTQPINQTKINEIKSYTEYKAYGYTILIYLVYELFLLIFLLNTNK